MSLDGTMPELYACKVCGLRYAQKKWAEKCENYCHSRKQCSPEIAKHAIMK